MSTRTIIAVLILLGAYLAISYDKRQAIAPEPSPVGCTEELMQCPDGSYVARIQPSCQFALCPTKPPVTSTISTGTIKGTVGLSPACGVMMDPPDPNCNFRAYETTISFTNSSGKIFKTNSGSDGKYLVVLPIGTYKIQAKGGEVLPRCPVDTILIKTNQDTVHNIDCESGIR